jgi:hypothetical protein
MQYLRPSTDIPAALNSDVGKALNRAFDAWWTRSLLRDVLRESQSRSASPRTCREATISPWTNFS